MFNSLGFKFEDQSSWNLLAALFLHYVSRGSRSCKQNLSTAPTQVLRMCCELDSEISKERIEDSRRCRNTFLSASQTVRSLCEDMQILSLNTTDNSCTGEKLTRCVRHPQSLPGKLQECIGRIDRTSQSCIELF